MKLQLKDKYLDTAITHPMTGKVVALRFIDKEEYNLIYQKGCEILFDIIEKVEEKLDTKKTNK